MKRLTRRKRKGGTSSKKPHYLGSISSDKNELDVLYESYKWIPNSRCIRPTEDMKLKKSDFYNNINKNWVSFEDYILYSIFNSEKIITKNIRSSKRINIENEKRFVPNMFPYQLEEGGQHWVMWYGTHSKTLSDEQISKDIEDKLRSFVGPNVLFNFAWYKNPKMSIPEFFHVQVFWTYLTI